MSEIHSQRFTGGATESNHPANRDSADNWRQRRATDVSAFRSKPAHNPTRYRNISETERVLSLAAGVGLGLVGLARGRLSGLALGAMGAALAWRGYSGHCQCYEALGINTARRNSSTAVPAREGCKIEKTIVVDCSPAELYSFWRRFENLPRVMRHLKNVECSDSLRSHWVAEGALGKDVEWDAEIINERENEMIAWRSLPGGDIETAGSVHFRRLSHGHGTEVTVSMKYNPPAGKVGAQIVSLLGEGLEDKLDADLATFQQVMETGVEPAPAIG